MKEEYDFSTAEQGKFYRPIDELDIPDLKTALLYAEQDIKDRWKRYRDRYKRRIRK